MKLAVRLRSAGGDLSEVALDSGRFEIVAERGFQYELLVDKSNARDSDHDLKARATRDGFDLLIDVPGSGVSLSLIGFYTQGSGEDAPRLSISSGGVDWASIDPAEPAPQGVLSAVPAAPATCCTVPTIALPCEYRSGVRAASPDVKSGVNMSASAKDRLTCAMSTHQGGVCSPSIVMPQNTMLTMIEPVATRMVGPMRS